MEQGSSRQIFVHMLEQMLKSRGAKVKPQQLLIFLEFIEEVCPWFPEEGTVNIETWLKVGDQLKTFYDCHGPERVPLVTFSLWAMIKDCLDFRHEREVISEKIKSTEESAKPEPIVTEQVPETCYEQDICKLFENSVKIDEKEEELLKETFVPRKPSESLLTYPIEEDAKNVQPKGLKFTAF